MAIFLRQKTKIFRYTNYKLKLFRMIIERPREQEEESFTDDKPAEQRKSYRAQKLERTPQHKQPVKEREIEDEPMATAVSDYEKIKLEDRPTAKVVREDGSTPRRRRAVSLGLSDLILPPFTKGVIARYRLINRGRIDPSTKEEPVANDAFFPGTYVLFDKFEADPLRRQKLMKNLGREDIVLNQETQKEERRYTIDPIEFINGVLDVNIEKNYRLYVFMELHPMNKSNKFRDNSNTVEFERIDIKMNVSQDYITAMADLALDAEQAVIKEITSTELIIGYAVNFSIDVYDRKPGEIKHDLRVAVRKDPKKFFSMAKNMAPAIKLNIHDGLGKGIISYEPSKHRFEFTETGEIMHVVPVGEEPVKDFTSAILNDPEKMEVYEEMMNMLNYWA